jgi:disulfide bond formation protein DsbB
MIRNLSAQKWGLFFTLASAAVLAAVFISQYGFGMAPCKLCIWQRWPYGIALILGLILFFKGNVRKVAQIMAILLATVFMLEACLALFHFGVEQHWWTFNSDCTGNAIKPGLSVQEMMDNLRRAPVVRCDQAVPFLFGMSMAFYNIFTSLGLAVLALLAGCYSSRSKALSQ